jgi:hypothetical protein
VLVGLPDVNLLGVDDDAGVPLRVHVESRLEGPVAGRAARDVHLDAHSAGPSWGAFTAQLAVESPRAQRAGVPVEA